MSASAKVQIIIFFRGSYFYATEYPSGYSNWNAEAARNPGTTRIETLEGRVLWPSLAAFKREVD